MKSQRLPRRRNSLRTQLALTFATFALSALTVRAQSATTPYVLEANFSATNLSLWGGSTASIINYQKFVGLEWNENGGFGGISSNLLGDFGLRVDAHTDGKVGFDVMFKSTNGDVTLNLPNTVTLNVPDLTIAGPATINVQQDRSLLTGQTDRIASTFPTAEFAVDAKFKINASVKATVAAFGSASGSLSLQDVRTALIPVAPALAVVNPFDVSLPIVKYNVNNDHKIEVLGGLFGLARKDLGNGFTYPLNTDTLTGGGGIFLPTKVEYGTLGVKTITQLDARSGDATSTSNSQSDVISIRANLLGLATLAFGLPINPFEPKIKVPGTPLTAEIELLSITAGVTLGLQQQLTLKSNTTLTLTSNMPVSYQIPGTNLSTGPVTSYTFTLPENGSAFDIVILQKPTAAEDPQHHFQIYPTIKVAPTLGTDLDLLTSLTAQVNALKLGVSAAGVGGGIGPLFTYDVSTGTLISFDIWNSLNNYSGVGGFKNSVRGFDSLVNPGAGLYEGFAVPTDTVASLQGQTATFELSAIDGQLNLSDFSFNNLDRIALAGELRLNGSNNQAITYGLDFTTPTAALKIDGGSTLEVRGARDGTNVYLVDPNGRRVPGFVDENGHVASGIYVLGGQLTYHGADIKSIGADVSMRLSDNASYSGTHLLRDADDANSPQNALAHLEQLDGTLWFDGGTHATDHSLALNGNLILRNGATFASTGLTGTAGFADLGAGSVLDARGGAFGYVDANGKLTSLTLSLGDPTGGAQLRYTGAGITENAADLMFLGTTPSGGFIVRDDGAGGTTNALATLTKNSGTLSLLNGATQSVTSASLENTGVLHVRDAGSSFTTTGDFVNNGILIADAAAFTANGAFTNNNSFALLNAATAHVGSLGNLDANGVLGGGGTWMLAGQLNYTANTPITGLALTTSLTITGANSGITNNTLGNPFATFASNAGTLALVDGATLNAASTSFQNTGTLQLTGTGSKLSTRGFTSTSGSTLEIGLGTTVDATGGSAALNGYWAANPTASSLTLDFGGFLNNAGTWTVAGDFIYTGEKITGLINGTNLILARAGGEKSITDATLDLNSGGGAFIHKTSGTSPVISPGLSDLTTIQGGFTLQSFVTFSTSSSLSLGTGGRLVLEPRSTLQVTGGSFDFGNGSTFDLRGNIILGGGSNSTQLTLPDNFSIVSNDGGGEIQLGRVTFDGTNYHTTGSGQIWGLGWTNQNYLIRGAGLLGGNGSFSNNGRIYATDGALQLAASSVSGRGTITNSGYLGSVSGGDLVLDSVIVNNRATIGSDLISGLFDLRAGAHFTNTDVNYGDLYLNPGGSLVLSGTNNLNFDSFKNLGSLELAASSIANFTSPIISTPGSTLTLGIGAVLNLDPRQAFVNRGTIVSSGTIAGADIQNDGLFQFGSGVTIDRLSNLSAGRITAPNGVTINTPFTALTLSNAGVFEFAGEDPLLESGTSATLSLRNDLTLVGGGIIQLGGFTTGIDRIDGDGFTYRDRVVDWGTLASPAGSGFIKSDFGINYTLTNTDNVIQGRGNIGGGILNVVNEAGGTIRSLGNGIDGELVIDSFATFQNFGTLVADFGTTLKVEGNAFDFTVGRYVIGGTLQLPDTGLFATDFDLASDLTLASSTARLTDGTHDASIKNILSTGKLTIGQNVLYTKTTAPGGASFENAGTLAVKAGGTAEILGGNFLNFTGTTLTGGRFIVDDSTLRFTDADIHTNAANLTLGGTGRIVDQSDQDALRHFDHNAAGASLTFNHGITYTLSDAAVMRNEGTFAVREGANVTLPVAVTQFINSGSASAGVVLVESGATLRAQAAQMSGFAIGGDPINGPGRYVIGGTLKMDGGFDVLATDLYIWGNGKLTNASNASVPFHIVTPTAQLTVANGTFDLTAPAFTNLGTIKVGSSTARDTNNALQSAAGTLAFHGTSLDGSGSLLLNSAVGGVSRLLVDGSLALTSRIEGGGDIHFLGANANFALGTGGHLAATGAIGGTLTVQFDQSGTFDNQGTVTVDPGHTLNLFTGGSDVVPAAQFTGPNAWALTGTWNLGGNLVVETPGAVTSLSAGTSLTLHDNPTTNAVVFFGDYPVYHDLLQITANAGTFTLLNTTYSGPTLTNTGTFTVDHSTLNSTVVTTPAGTLQFTGSTINGALTGTGDVHYTGAAASRINGTTFYTGQTFIDAGATLILGSTDALGRRIGNTVTVKPDAVMLGAGATLLNDSGAAYTLRSLLGITYADNATIDGGTGANSFSAPDGIKGTGTLNIGGNVSANLGLFSETLNLLGGSTLTLFGSEVFTGTLNGTGTLATPNSLTIVSDGNFSGTVVGTTGATNISIGNGGSTGRLNANMILDGFVTFNRTGAVTYDHEISGAASLIVKGGMALTLTADQAYTGGTTIVAGSSLQLGDGGFFGALADGAPVTNNGSLIFDLDRLFTPGALSGSGTFVQAGSRSLTLVGANTSKLSQFRVDAGTLVVGDGSNLGGVISGAANNGTLAFNSAGSLTVAANGTLTGSGTIHQRGAGSLLLTAGQTFTGRVVVGELQDPDEGPVGGGGTLQISADSSLGAVPGSYTAGQLTLNNGTLVTFAPVTFAATRGLAIGPGGGTISGDLTVPSVVSFGGALTTLGQVSLGLSPAVVTDITVGGGTLVLDNLGSLSTFTGTLAGGDSTVTHFAGSGRTYFLSDTNYAGKIVVDAGTTMNLQSTIAGAFTVDGTLEFQPTTDLTFALPGGSGRVEQLGHGTVTLAAPHTGQFRGKLALNSQLGVTETASLSTVFAGPTTFVADALTFNGGTLRVTSSDSTSSTMGVRVDVSGKIDLPGATLLQFNAPLSGTGTLALTGTGSLVLANVGSATNHFDIGGGDLVISGLTDLTLSGALSGTGGLSISTGPGKVILTTYNTYAGGTTVFNGTLQLGDGGSGIFAGSVPGAISVGSFGNVAYAHSDDLTLPNTITGAGGLIQAGTGTLTIDSAQAYTGTTKVSAGTLRLLDGASFAGAVVNNATLLFDDPNTTTFAADISGTGKVVKDDTHTLTPDHGTTTLTGHNSYTGATEVKAGTLVLTTANSGNGGGAVSTGATLRLTDSGTLGGTLTNNGTFELNRTDSYSLDLAATGSGTIVKTGAGDAYLTRAADSANNLSLLAGNFGYDLADGDTAILSGQISGNGQLLKAGAGTLVLTQNNGSANGATISGGTLQLGDNTATGSIAGAITVADGATLAYKRSNTIALGDAFSGAGRFAQLGSGTVILTGDFTHTGGTTIASGSTLQIGSNGTVGSLAGNVANDGTLLFNRANAYTFAGDTTGLGTLRQSGSGTLTLTGEHTATGGAIIDSGRTLALDTTAILTGPVTNAGNLTILTDPNATLDRELPVSVSGIGGLTIDGGGTLRIAGDLTYSGTTTIANASTLKLVNDNTSTLANTINGSGNFVKLGEGTLILTADSTLSGTVTVAQGTLQLGNDGTTGSIGGSVSTSSIDLQGGTLAIKHSDAITMNNAISGGGGLAQLGSGRLTLTNDNLYLGGTHVGANSELQLGVGGATGSVIGHLDVDGLLVSTKVGAWAINAGLTGSGTISKSYTGNSSDWITIAGDANNPIDFTGTVSYLGGTVAVVNTGTLGTVTADHLRVIGANLTLIGNNGALDTLNNGTLTIGNGGTSGTFSGAITGGGTLAFNRSDAFTFDGSIASGTLHQRGTGTTTFNNSSHLFAGTVQIDDGNLILNTLVGGSVVNDGTLTLAYGQLDDGSTLSGTGKVITASSGTTYLPSNLSYTGETEIAGGTLELSPNGSTTTLTGLVTGAGGLRVATRGTVALGSGGTYTGPTELISNPTLKVGGGLASDVSGSGSGTVDFDLTTGATASGNLSGSIALTKSGTGTLTLTGVNTHTGETRVESGTLRAGSSTSFSGESSLFLANTFNALLDLANFDTLVLMLIGGGTDGGHIDLGSGRLTVSPHTTFGTPLDGTYAGNITGTGGLTMDGHGTLTLTGTNSYTGGTSILQGTLAAAGDSSLGLGTVLLNGGTLRIDGNTTFGNTRPIQTGSADGTLNVSNGITATIDTAITGTGSFFKDGAGAALLNATPTNSGLVQINAGSLALGSGTLTSSQLLINGGYLDLNGHTWSTPLNIYAGGVANSSNTAALVSGQLDTHGTLALQSTGGDLRVTGALTSTNGPVYLSTDGTGRISLGSTPSANLGRIDVNDGTLAIENTAALTALDGFTISNRSQVELAGGNATLALDYLEFRGNAFLGDIAGLQNTAAGTSIRLETTSPGNPLHFYGDGLAGAAVLLGGAGDLTIALRPEGGANIAKIGAGRLSLEGNYADWTGSFDVRAGTLAVDSALLQDRTLNMSGGSLDLGSAASVSLAALTGNGALALGSTALTLNATNAFTFGGSITTTGNVTKDGSAAATFGAVTASSVIVDAGSATFAGNLSANDLTIHAGDAYVTGSIAPGTLLRVAATDYYTTGGALHVAVDRVTSNGGTTFTGNLETNGYVEITGMTQDITANTGRIVLTDFQNQISGDYSTLGSIASNSGTLAAQNGASLSVASTFTNTGTVSVTGANTGLNVGFGSATAITQSAGSLTVGAGSSVTVRNLNVAGGTTSFDGTLFNFSGSPTLTVSGGTLTGSGQINGRLTLNGGTFSPGNSPGTMTVTNSTWNGGGEFRFELNALPGDGVAGTNWDLLSISNALTLAATSANRFTIDLVTLTSGNVAGLLDGFDLTQSYTWSFVTAGSIANFDANAFAITTTGFANAFQGTFAIKSSVTGLDLVYTYNTSAIPEPSTYAALLGACVLGLAALRRRRGSAGIPRRHSA